MRNSYKRAGVDIKAGNKSVALMKKHVESTFSSNVLSKIGGFCGMFSIKEAAELEEPVLCSSTDGVGTKLKIAFLMNKHDTVGIDCVAMCVNDLICAGAKPLFFLDYIACGKMVPERIEEIVKGIAAGCRISECSLVGGETAEMPGFYPDDEYDIAGFCAGIVDKKKIIDGKKIKEGDAVIGIASNGIHSNGFSLVRSILRPSAEKISEHIVSLNQNLGEELLTPTRIYVKPILKLIETVPVNGIVNITGGGFYENIPRVFPKGLGAEIQYGSWEIPPIFGLLQGAGKLSDKEMFTTFNMGVGMIAIVPEECTEETIDSIEQSGEEAALIGRIVKGDGVTICSE